MRCWFANLLVLLIDIVRLNLFSFMLYIIEVVLLVVFITAQFGPKYLPNDRISNFTDIRYFFEWISDSGLTYFTSLKLILLTWWSSRLWWRFEKLKCEFKFERKGLLSARFLCTATNKYIMQRLLHSILPDFNKSCYFFDNLFWYVFDYKRCMYTPTVSLRDGFRRRFVSKFIDSKDVSKNTMVLFVLWLCGALNSTNGRACNGVDAWYGLFGFNCSCNKVLVENYR